MRWFRRLLPWIIIIAASAIIIYIPDTGPEKYTSLSELFKQEKKRQANSGFSVTVARNGNIMYQESFGQDGLGMPLAKDTPMYLGPSSEVLTGALLFSLSLSGEINIDENLYRYLPSIPLQTKIKAPEDEREGKSVDFVTVRQFAAHSLVLDGEALAEYGSRTLGLEAGELDPEAYFMTRLREKTVSRSRLVYRILGTAMENATNMDFDELLQERILIPLGMHGTTSKPYSLQGVAVGSGLFFGLSFPYESRVPYIAAPADGIVSTIGDMGRFLTYVSAAPRIGIKNLPPLTVPGLFKPLLPEGDTGFGWRIVKDSSPRMVFQGGSVEGFSSRIVLWPERRTSIAILSAQGGVIQSNVVLPLLTSAAENIIFNGVTSQLPPIGRILMLCGVAFFVYVTSIFLQTATTFSWVRTLLDRRETRRGDLYLKAILARTMLGIAIRCGLLVAAPLLVGRIVGTTLLYHDLLTMEPGASALFIIAMIIGLLRNLARLIWFLHLKQG
jgi:CubicO group peptidase (beta-lactamase class C family)